MDTNHHTPVMPTTETRTEVLSHLNSLLRYINDGVEGYQNALENVSSPSLKAHFEKFLLQRKKFSTELKSEIVKLGEKFEDENKTGEILGFFHRLWMDIKSGLSSNEELAILESAEMGDQAALDLYRDTIEKFRGINYHNDMIANQYSGIETALSEVKYLKSVYKKA